MKTLCIDAAMGAAGDMLTAALSELLPEDFTARLNAMGVPHTEFRAEKVTRGEVPATYMNVSIHGHGEDEHHHHHHSNLESIADIISGLNLPDAVKSDAYNVYRLIAEAEGEVHGETPELVHFHEVGALDAVADVCAVCLGIHLLEPDWIYCSPVNAGSGTVRCAHGELDVPAPATAVLLKNIPWYLDDVIETELCTPTGAALLKYFVHEFKSMPAMTGIVRGAGAGKKDFPAEPNVVRVLLGEETDIEQIYETAANIDDMTGEELSFARERLFGAGAVDAWCESIQMKKGRPAVKLCAITKPENLGEVLSAYHKYTSSLGVRYSRLERSAVLRGFEVRNGARLKRSAAGVKVEFDDLERIALERGLTLSETRDTILDGD